MTESNEFWVGDRLVRPSLGEVQLGPERVHLEPRSMEVLLALVDRAPEVVSKQALIDAVWGEAFVSDEVLTHAIWDLRRALGDNASDPEFIQTIPKRGYRLIAPVKPVGEPRRRATDREPKAAGSGPGASRWPRPWRAWLLGLVALAALIWLVTRTTGGRQADPGSTAPRARQVVLLTVAYPDGPRAWGEVLEAGLGKELAGTDLQVIPVDSCEGAAETSATYCLEARLLRPADYEAAVRLLEATGGALAYSTSSPVDGDGGNLEAVAAELGGKVRTYFEVIEDPFFDDPDVRPWLSLQDHDIRAIRDFLHGLAYVYRNEHGGADPMTTAMELDPGFVAPRVFRTPTLVGESDADALARHRDALDGLYAEANAFEKPMLKWAVALIDGDSAEQIQKLRVALRQVGGNRQIEYVLGITLAAGGGLDEAWSLIEPLLGQAWHFPGLYSGAAQIAILRDRIDDIRRALDLALEVDPVDPEALAVMIVLAMYDDDAESERRFRKRLAARRGELGQASDSSLDVGEVARALADRAAREGREEIAARLRESAD